MTNPAWRWLAAVCAILAALAGSQAQGAHSKADRVNVRSRPGYSGEVITQLKRGQEIRVVGTNTLSKPAPDEPPVWFKIELPADALVWANAEFIEADSKAVTADMLNLRAGPGLEFAVVGRVAHGVTLQPQGGVNNGWIQVAATPGSFGFVPAVWIAFEDSQTPAAVAPAGAARNSVIQASSPSQTPRAGVSNTVPARLNTTSSTTTTNVSTPPLAARPLTDSEIKTLLDRQAGAASVQPSQTAAVVPDASGTRASTEGKAPGASPALAAVGGTAVTNSGSGLAPLASTNSQGVSSASLEPDNREARRVRREGIVIRPFNFAAPTYYALQARDSGKTMNFLFSSRPDPINWQEFRGKVVIVTGREYLDKRTYWQGIPLLDVEAVDAVR